MARLVRMVHHGLGPHPRGTVGPICPRYRSRTRRAHAAERCPLLGPQVFGQHDRPGQPCRHGFQVGQYGDGPGRRGRLTPAAHVLIRHGDILESQWEAASPELRPLGAQIGGALRMCGVSSALAALAAPAAARLRPGCGTGNR
ncbi:hypothetical protein [Streptomyces sp. NPDC021212]|uniref:hypothetical protein n=1 Tax=Streptomyces sp. NPDC021212 TaxID=3365118 RepID=UPI0037A7953D